MYMYVCVHIYIYTYINSYIFIYTYRLLQDKTFEESHGYVKAFRRLQTHIYIYMNVYACVCKIICSRTFTNIYIECCRIRQLKNRMNV